jgi:hypothetical protein
MNAPSAPPLRSASRAIRTAYLRHARGLVERWRVTGPIRTIDGMLEDLEQMNLRSARRVPLVWDSQLALLMANLPFEVSQELRGELRAGISPNRLMDALYVAQDQLLDLKVGPGRRRLNDEDESEEPARAPMLPGAA